MAGLRLKKAVPGKLVGGRFVPLAKNAGAYSFRKSKKRMKSISGHPSDYKGDYRDDLELVRFGRGLKVKRVPKSLRKNKRKR
jgi:hypothetical protein